MNIQKLVLTEADGTTVESVSTTGGFSAVVATLTDGSEVAIFPVVPTPDPVVSLTSHTQSGVATEFVPKV